MGKTLLWWHSLLANLLQSEKALHVTCKLWTITPPWWGNNASTCSAMEAREFGVSLKQQRCKLCASFAICRIYTIVMPWLEGKGWQVCRQPYHPASSRAPATNILWEFQWAIYDKLDAPKRWPPKKSNFTAQSHFWLIRKKKGPLWNLTNQPAVLFSFHLSVRFRALENVSIEAVKIELISVLLRSTHVLSL